jgi:hypothetical protein
VLIHEVEVRVEARRSAAIDTSSLDAPSVRSISCPAARRTTST